MQAQIIVCAMEVLVILIVICMAARRCRSRIKLRKMGEEEREKLTKGWKKAVAAAAAFDVV